MDQQILSSYNDIDKTGMIFSKYTGQLLFCHTVDHETFQHVVESIRDAEDEAFERAKELCIKNINAMKPL